MRRMAAFDLKECLPAGGREEAGGGPALRGWWPDAASPSTGLTAISGEAGRLTGGRIALQGVYLEWDSRLEGAWIALAPGGASPGWLLLASVHVVVSPSLLLVPLLVLPARPAPAPPAKRGRPFFGATPFWVAPCGGPFLPDQPSSLFLLPRHVLCRGFQPFSPVPPVLSRSIAPLAFSSIFPFFCWALRSSKGLAAASHHNPTLAKPGGSKKSAFLSFGQEARRPPKRVHPPPPDPRKHWSGKMQATAADTSERDCSIAEKLQRHHWVAAARLAQRMLNEPGREPGQTAQEIAQEAMVSMLRAYPAILQSPSALGQKPLEEWRRLLMRATKHQVFDHHRKNGTARTQDISKSADQTRWRWTLWPSEPDPCDAACWREELVELTASLTEYKAQLEREVAEAQGSSAKVRGIWVEVVSELMELLPLAQDEGFWQGGIACGNCRDELRRRIFRRINAARNQAGRGILRTKSAAHLDNALNDIARWIDGRRQRGAV